MFSIMINVKILTDECEGTGTTSYNSEYCRYSTVLTVPVLTCPLLSLRSYFTEDNFFFFY